MARLTAAFKRMIVSANGMRVECGVVDFVGYCCRVGFKQGGFL